MPLITIPIFRHALWLPFLSASIVAQAYPMFDVVTYHTFETRDYFSENGRRIRITSLGNLTSLESPYGFEHIDNGVRAREGYVIAYTDPGTAQARVLFDVHDIYSSVLGTRDLAPYSFIGPASGTVFPVNTPVSATVVVDTADGLLRLTHQIDWQAGLGGVTITTTVANRVSAPLSLTAFKRHADIHLDASGGYGVAAASNWTRTPDGFVAHISCYCAPQPGPPPLTPITASLHTLTFTGSPASSYKMIHSDADNSELYLAGPANSTDLPGLRTNENDQTTLVWLGSVLPAGGSRSFTAHYQQQ